MSTTVEQRSYEDALSWLRDHGFDLIEAPGTPGRVFLKKYSVSAAIQKDGDDGVKIFAFPGYLIGSEISKLFNRGYQQFLKTAKTEVPATADPLQPQPQSKKAARSDKYLRSDSLSAKLLGPVPPQGIPPICALLCETAPRRTHADHLPATRPARSARGANARDTHRHRSGAYSTAR